MAPLTKSNDLYTDEIKLQIQFNWKKVSTLDFTETEELTVFSIKQEHYSKSEISDAHKAL